MGCMTWTDFVMAAAASRLAIDVLMNGLWRPAGRHDIASTSIFTNLVYNSSFAPPIYSFQQTE